MNEITKALQDNANSRSRNTRCGWQSTWLVDNTNVYAAPLSSLLELAQSLTLTVIEKTNHRTEAQYYILENEGNHAGMIDQTEYPEDKALTPDGWLLILNKEFANA